jgi:hypothetical protein
MIPVDIKELIELFVLLIFVIHNVVCSIVLIIITNNRIKHDKFSYLEIHIELTKLLFHIIIKK